MSVSGAVSALKQGLLRHLRVPLQQQTVFNISGSSTIVAGTSFSLWRGFAGGGYLDKDQVIERVLHVTKHFEKIDPHKVGRKAHARDVPGLCCQCDLTWSLVTTTSAAAPPTAYLSLTGAHFVVHHPCVAQQRAWCDCRP